MTRPAFTIDPVGANISGSSMLLLSLLTVGCPAPEVAAPATTGVEADSDTDAATTTTSTSSAATTTTAEPTTSSATTADTTTSSAATTAAATTAVDTTAVDTTSAETTMAGTTTGETSTGDGTTGVEEPCPAFSSTPDPRFDALLAKMQAQAVTPSLDYPAVPSGLAIAIVVDGELRHAAGVGTRAKAGHALADAPVGADTLFWIASTSKWIHGTMVSSLVEDGLLDFDAPVTAVLPDYKETNGKQNDITLHHLLTMTSSLASDYGCTLFSVSESQDPAGCAAVSKGPGTVLQSLFEPDRLAIKPYKFLNTASGTPGLAPFDYSNWGIMLSGRMAEAVGGAAESDLVTARVFKPAHMCSATYDPSVMLGSGDYAVGSGSPDWDGKCLELELGHDSKAPWEPDELACRARDPNGGVRASVVDVGRFAEAFLADLKGGGSMLGTDAAQRMLCPGGGTVDDGCIGRVSTNGDPNGDTYGYTNFHQTTKGHDVYTHGGGRPGYGALFWIVPKHNFAVVILANEMHTAGNKFHWAESVIDCWLNDVGC